MTPTAAERPTVVLTATASVDGRITLGLDRLLLDPDAGAEWQRLHPPSATGLLAERDAGIRSEHDPTATLVGSSTFVHADAGPAAFADVDGDAVPDGDFLPPEVVGHPDHRHWFVAVDSRGRVPWTFTGGDGTDLLVLVAETTPPAYLAFLRRERIPYLVAGVARVEPTVALDRLRDRLGVRAVVLDGGGGINAVLLADGLVDEVHVLVLPALIGGSATPSVIDGEAPVPTALRLRDARVEPDGGVLLRYDVVR